MQANSNGGCSGIVVRPSTAQLSFIGTTSNQDLHIGTNDGTNQNITIAQQTGFVGINQQQPATDLDVNGTVHVANQVNVDGGVQVNQNAVINGNLEVGTGENNANGQMKARLLQLFKVDGSSNDGYLDLGRASRFWHITQRNNVNDEFQILRFNQASNPNWSAPFFRIKSDGKVIIGGDAPAIGNQFQNYTLAVSGLINSKEVVVTPTAQWPDYVFEQNYQVTPLAEVEQFIKTNKHLPEIPSASEVKENGIQLGEMNAKLLKKIEELTLYLIQQQKEIEALKAKVK